MFVWSLLITNHEKLLPDRTSRLPLNVQYVPNKGFAGLRYFMELYINLNHDGSEPLIDDPICAEYPPCNLLKRGSLRGAADLTQDAFRVPNEDDEESLEDPEEKDIPR